jgi:hypothetical protein
MLMVYEVIQIKMTSTVDYRSDNWNKLDWALFVTHFVYLVFRILHFGEHLVPGNMGEITSMDQSLQATLVIQIILVVMLAFKNLHLLRVYEGQGMLVQLLFTCFFDIRHFMFLLCYFLFTLFFMYVLSGANLGDEKDYPEMYSYLASFT